jgi:hypothetical protein
VWIVLAICVHRDNAVESEVRGSREARRLHRPVSRSPMSRRRTRRPRRSVSRTELRGKRQHRRFVPR